MDTKRDSESGYVARRGAFMNRTGGENAAPPDTASGAVLPNGEWLPRLRATFTVEPWMSGGCGYCEGTGVVVDDDPDEEHPNPWDAKTECTRCSGEGIQHCEAEGCQRAVRRRVRSATMSFLCCGHAACTQEHIETVLSGTWTNHRVVAATVLRDGGL
jgi:hypothetical protein